MANLPPDPNSNKLRHSGCSCDQVPSSTLRPTMLLIFCVALLSVAAATLPQAAAIEVDNDLVFDDAAAERVRHGHNSTAAPLRREQLVAPVQSPQTVDDMLDEPDTGGLLAALHGLGERAKKTLWDGLGMLGHTRERRQADQDNEVGDDEETDPQMVGQSDDEDYINDELSGSGNPPTQGSDQARFYRITLNIVEPYRVEYANRTNPEFIHLASRLSRSVENLYSDWPGRRSATVLKMSKNPDDQFSTLVLMDLGVSGYGDEHSVRSRLWDNISRTNNLGEFQVKDDPFNFRVHTDDRVYSATRPSCGDHELTCQNGECIPQHQRCDDILQCGDGSDEEGCQPKSRPTPVTPDIEADIPRRSFTDEPQPARCDDQVRCEDSSVYICQTQRCDGRPDCPNGSDEAEDICGRPTACRVGEFMCDLSRCISKDKHCDGQIDCTDETDEMNCPPAHTCPEGEFLCDRSRCVPNGRRCDGRHDCSDRTDEDSCPEGCGLGEFTCGDGLCIDDSKVCNRVADCDDFSDEVSCPTCQSHEWMCNDGTCVDKSKRCDGTADCPQDGSDEKDCGGSCRENEFQCDDGSCIYDSLKCNQQSDCYDGSDERNCDVPSCHKDQFRCNDGLCLNINKRCDGYPECSQGEDEASCGGVVCLSSEFPCKDGRKCIAQSGRCNGRRECDDNSDEDDCDCTSDQFQCGNGVCIDKELRCDETINCDDATDEHDCGLKRCRSDEFQCDNGECITHYYRCDDQEDCTDGSDERNCPRPTCSPSDFVCDGDKCLSQSKKCDNIADCVDQTDERDCPVKRCRSDEFRCANGDCIPDYYHCDDQDDCRDGSDEHDCPGPTCSPSDFVCDGNKCLSQSKKCDNIDDCVDQTDERDCPVKSCSSEEFLCANGDCIPHYYLCDDQQDCPDGSDERNCSRSTCSPSDFVCDISHCLSSSKKCDGTIDCIDMTDEKDCEGTCELNQYRCADGTCIPENRRCDQYPDCPDTSDEHNCEKTCGPLEFTCGDGKCIDSRRRCDRHHDCEDHSDERDCEPRPTQRPPHPTCDSNQFTCRTSRECIPQSAVCDKRYDCQDFSDEEERICNSRDGLNLKTYPDDQIIKESREVVFQCRDEGPLRARVRWVRGNGLPLPPGSRDINGRLEMPDIQVEHSGTYICEAVGHPADTPGQRVSVHLSVEAFTPPPTRPPGCGFYEATCANGECISKTAVCDKKLDCSDGSDEMRCNPFCEPNEFRCKNKRCVLKTWLCDSDDDCGDGSDEENCATNPPGSPCRYNEFQCRTGGQCIPKSFHCDLQNDCLDNSDEIGCSPVYISVPPPPMVMLDPGSVFTITCTTIGVPTPEVVWRLNWGHIPPKCTTESKNGVGTLTCPNIEESDQGAYSCEAINTRGSTFAVPDSILVVKKPASVCPRGYFNDEATNSRDCISCFCFGITTECQSANLFTYQLPPPLTDFKLVGVRVEPSGEVNIRTEAPFRSSPIRSHSRNGFQLYSPNVERLGDNTYTYFALPENYHGNQLKSYGGYLKYTVRPEGQGRPLRIPDVILTGKGYTLVHRARPPNFGQNNDVTVHFFYGEWYKRVHSRPGGDIPISSEDEKATREEIMMTLSNVDNILIKGQYVEGSFLDTTFSNIVMDSAGIRNTGQGKASFVEECRCPAGYTGLSCEQCAPGFHRHQSGPWLGHCTRETVPCPPGQYGDPSRNIQCQTCPCPLTSPANQFGRSCQLDTDSEVTCSCPPGYTGRRCERCDTGYEGNPIISGDSCRPASHCDAAGSVAPQPDPSTGLCRCKEHVTGPQCNQCKAEAFHLDPQNENGCIPCFCMGIIEHCRSSNWYRQQVAASFTRNVNDFKLVEAQSKDEPITDGIRFDSSTREIVFSEFSRRSPHVYYWTLPSQFVGDKITSYGGKLKYTLRYIPAPGGLSSRNNAPDVQLISTNDIHLMYFSREQVNPDRPQAVEVPLLEQYWQRQDGQPVDREHMLMTLADLGSVLIKATYTTNTREVALIQVSLDVAEDRNTGQTQAVEVEQCQCPVGYRGLSCQDCDVGYTRTDGGLYLGFCEPCNCNDRSEECDPESGVCRNCQDYSGGPQCEECAPGYEGDPDRNTCQPSSSLKPSCNCDPRGSQRTDCPDGANCICKTNVEGPSCNTCRRGTFDLSAENVAGCLECFCSDVTDSCQGSNLQRQQIPMQLIDQNHDFTLTDSNRGHKISDTFVLNVAQNEIGYDFRGRDQRLFWSLPPQFTGNKVTSYGGNLTVTQRYTARPGSARSKDTDIIIVGNGISIYWTGTDDLQPDRPLTYSVPLRESEWHRLVPTGPRTASRADLLTVLSNVEAILIRAHHASQSLRTYLSDVSLDTAVEQYTGQGAVHSVEVCRCPQGYRGSSCESCTSGYYRVFTNKQDGVSVCEKCPCNGNEESCYASLTGGVVCKCVPGYTGRFCDNTELPIEPSVTDPTPQSPTILVTISEPSIRIVEAGQSVRFQCSGQSIRRVPVTIVWSKEGGVLPRDRAIDDSRGVLIITRVEPPDSGTYVCSVFDGTDVVSQKTTLTVGGSPSTRPQITISPPSITTSEGDTAEFQCDVQGVPTPIISWTRRDHRPLSPQAYFSGGTLRIRSVQKSDEGEYYCHAWNQAGNVTRHTVLYVQDRGSGSSSGSPLAVEPSEYTGSDGETVRLLCHGSPDANIQWSRAGNRDLPPLARAIDGTLYIYNPTAADSGIYVCRNVRYPGTPEEVQVRVTITHARAPPTSKIEPNRQTVSQGTVAELRCQAAGDPSPQVTWTKLGEDMPSNVQVTGSVLRIMNVQVRDRGVYLCTVSNAGGTSQDSATVEVERRERPSVDLYPAAEQTVVKGNSVLLQCRATAGIPQPTVQWSRVDGRPFSQNVEKIDGGVLRFNQVTEADKGQYICRAENAAGTHSITATLNVQSLPKISITPVSPVQATVGRSVRLECRATGDPAPVITWSKHRPGSSFYDPQPVTPERQQSAVYEITSVSKSDEGSYSCIAKNDAGLSEERLYLSVEESNVITGPEYPYPTHRPPTPVRPGGGGGGGGGGSGISVDNDVFEVPVGGRAEMRCIVRANLGASQLFLRWARFDSGPMPRNSREENGILYIDQVQKTDEGEYSCLGYRGSTLEFRANARLRVIAPPQIHLHPHRQVVRPGNNANITCSATGDQPISIEWRAVNRNLPRTVDTRGGLLLFRGIAVSDAGRYLCRARNSAGETESTAEVIVEEGSHRIPPTTSSQRDQTAAAGSTVGLRCMVPPGIRALRYSWSRDRAPLPRNAVVRENVLQLFNVQMADRGRYICHTTTDAGEATTYINLQVDQFRGGCAERGEFRCRSGQCVPMDAACNDYQDCQDGSDEECSQGRRGRGLQNLELRIDPSQSVVHVGDTVDVRCSARGDSDVSYTWTKVGERLAHNVEVTEDMIRIIDVRSENGGVYRCTVQASSGQYSEDYVLTILDSLPMNGDAAAVETRTAPYGSTVTMDCKTELEEPVTYSWSKQGGALPRNADAQLAVLTLTGVGAQDAGTYVCTARNQNVQMDIPTVLVVTGIVPYFAQSPSSYMVLPTLAEAYTAFNIAVSFKPEQPNGLILYNGQQSGGSGDFISLGLNNSYLEFRFDVGSGPAVIRSAEPITLNEWHSVKLHRERRIGKLTVDNQTPVTGQTSGRFVGLDLVEPLYVGSVPDFSAISKLNGFQRGFVGCVSRLMIGSNVHELVREATTSHGMMICDTCANKPCYNNGVCQEATEPEGYTCICALGFSGLNCDRVGEACYPGACGVGRCVSQHEGFKCYCPFGKAGERCDRDIEISEPAFADDAYVAYQTPPRAMRQLNIGIKFKPADTEDGVLMYCAQDEDGHGDFTSLAIRNKHVEFRYDTGSGPAIIRSEQDIIPGQWSTATAHRNMRHGQLSVNNEPPVQGRSPGITGGLNLRTPLYVGGVDKQRVRLAPGVQVDNGFRGCVSEIKVANIELEIVNSVVDAANVQDCSQGSEDSPCHGNPCRNGGACRPGPRGGYNCSCQYGFSGKNCETEADVCQALRPCQNGGSCVGSATNYKCRCPLGFGGIDCEQSLVFGTEVGFQGDGYLELSNSMLPHKTPTENESIVIEFTTSEPNGVIFWHGQAPETDGKKQDYLSLAVVNGTLEFGYELGSGPALIQASKRNVADGQRHRVVLKRLATDGSLELDDIGTEFGKSQGILQMLNTRGNIYIGGTPNLKLMTAGNYTSGFVGCIHSIEIQKSGIINLRDSALSSVNAAPCSNHDSIIDNEVSRNSFK